MKRAIFIEQEIDSFVRICILATISMPCSMAVRIRFDANYRRIIHSICIYIRHTDARSSSDRKVKRSGRCQSKVPDVETQRWICLSVYEEAEFPHRCNRSCRFSLEFTKKPRKPVSCENIKSRHDTPGETDLISAEITGGQQATLERNVAETSLQGRRRPMMHETKIE
jgi:hypothetical protein